MTKIALNKDYGGFGLSHAAIMRLAELKGIKLYPIEQINVGRDYRKPRVYRHLPIGVSADDTPFVHYITQPLNNDGTYPEEAYWSEYEAYKDRTDPLLIQVIEELGSQKASGDCAHIDIVEIPDDVTDWVIDNYDGIEHVEEAHREWY